MKERIPQENVDKDYSFMKASVSRAVLTVFVLIAAISPAKRLRSFPFTGSFLLDRVVKESAEITRLLTAAVGLLV